MTRDYRLFLNDIIESIRNIESFIAGLTFEDFINDDKTNSAVVRQLEIIGEAVKNIPKEITDKSQDIPWKEIAGTRDKIIHGYFSVDYELVWKIATERLTELDGQIKEILNSIKNLE